MASLHGFVRRLALAIIGSLTRSTFIALLVLITGAATPANARLWVVSNSGVDSVSCGSFASPCRSISQAIANASDGDLIGVGIGQYGDVSGKADYSGPGDERAGPMINGNGEAIFFKGCVLCIDKAVTITSFAGAAETVIQGNLAATQFPTVVGITRDGVTFGTPGHGFTITGGKWAVGIAEACDNFTANVSVAGNVAVGENVGFEFVGYFAASVTCPNPGQVQLSNNTAIGNAHGGFIIVPDEFFNPIVVQKNLAMGSAGAGFTVDPGSFHGPNQSGFAGNVTLLKNVAIQNNYGFSLAQVGKAQYNTAANNIAAGFSLDGDLFPPPRAPYTIFSYNAAVGNRGPGVIVYAELGFADLSHNDFIGNDRDRTVTSLFGGQLNLGPSAHCGLLNTGFSQFADGPEPPGTKLRSLYDFWGVSQGPLAEGAGDNAGGVCDKNGAITTVVPFSTTAYAFTSVALLLQ